MSEEKPWEDYVSPLPPSGRPPPGPSAGMITGQPVKGETDVGYAEDIAKGAAGGLGRGLTGLAGLPGDVSEYGARGLDYATRKVGGWLGQDIAPRQARDPSYGSAAAQRTVEGVTGRPFYQPKTVPGQYASTIAEFAPGAVIPGSAAARVANTVIPAVTSETAGQITSGTAAEPWARAAGGIVGGVGGAKLITPTAPTSAARQAAVNTLQGEGIPLTAGQRTGSRPLQWMESTAADMPVSAGRAQNMQAGQKAAYDRAVTERIYDRGELTARGVPADVNLPDPRVATAGRQSLSDEYTRLSQNQLRSDPQLFRDLAAAERQYARDVLPSQRTGDVVNIRDDIADRLVQGLGRMPGGEYQATRSRLGTLAKGQTNDPYLRTAFRDMQGAMDRAMQRGLSPDDAAAWALNNRRWGNMRQTEPAVASAGENLSPARVAQTARTGRAGQYAQQQGDFDELSRAASIVMKDLPQSGTGPRTQMQTLLSLPTLLSAGGGGVLGGLIGNVPGAIAGAALPSLAARAVVSRPGQAYLGNQALPQRKRDVLAQTLAQQAISQPSGIERNRREREEYERKRKNR